MEENPLVSIIVPVYNRETIVKRALDAAISQTYTNIEIIVCDNASTDNTWQTLQQYATIDNRIHIYQNDTNVGPVKNWEECLKHISGDYVKFLWSDDSISPDFIERTLPIMLKYSNVGFVFSRALIIKRNSEMLHYLWQKTGFFKTNDFIRACLFGGKEVPVSPGCAMFRAKDVISNLRCEIPNNYGFDFPRYGAGNDLLLFLYSCKDYTEFYYIDETLSFFYGGEDSISMNTKISNYYTYSKYLFVKEFADQKLKNEFYTDLIFDYLSEDVQNEKFSINWKRVFKTIGYRCKIFLRSNCRDVMKLLRYVFKKKI